MKSIGAFLLAGSVLAGAGAFVRYAYMHQNMAGLFTLLAFLAAMAGLSIAFVWLVWDCFVRDATRGIRR